MQTKDQQDDERNRLHQHPHQAGDTDKNISRIVERYDSNKCFVAR